MSKTFSKFALTASLVLAMALTFSCSGDDGGGEEKFSYCIKDGFCHEGPYTLESCSSWGIPSNNCPNGGGGGSSSSVGGQGGGSSSSGGGSNMSDLPTQVYLVTMSSQTAEELKQEEYKGNGNIMIPFEVEDTEIYDDSISAGEIQNGRLSLNLPASVNSKYLRKFEPCNDEYCQSNISVVPENLTFYERSSLHADIPGRSDCSFRAYMKKSGEITGRARFYYSSESGRITGTETYGCGDGGITCSLIWDVSFSKGWNLVYYYDSGQVMTITDLQKDGTLEWDIYCFDGDG